MAAHYIYKINSMVTAFSVTPTLVDINYVFTPGSTLPQLTIGDLLLIYKPSTTSQINMCLHVNSVDADSGSVSLTKTFDVANGCSLEAVSCSIISQLSSLEDNSFISIEESDYNDIVNSVFESSLRMTIDQSLSIEGVDSNDYTVEELGNILKDLYSNADPGNQVVSIFLFGIKYGLTISNQNIKAKQIILASGISDSYETELSKSLKIFGCLKSGIYNLSLHNDSTLGKDKAIAQGLEQKIFYGAPGTGKSYKVDSITAKYKHSKVTFHPDTDYSSFVGCYKPSLDSAKDIITYSFVPQVFAKAYVAAWKNLEKPYYLVIEEINRGNCAQIFGDIFQLLDRNDAGFSKYAIDVDSDFADYLKSELSGVEGYLDKIKELAGPEHTVDYSTIVLPNNLSIIATMNTSDQSLFPMDSAFKRRWDWEYIPIDPMKDEVKNVKIDIDGTHYSWSKFLENVNKSIYEVNTSEDKQLGQFFATKGEDITFEQFRSKVMFYLWFEIYKDEDAKSIFKVYKEGSSNEMEPFTFGDLFKADGVDKLNKFMVDSMKLDVLNKNPEEEIEQQAEAVE